MISKIKKQLEKLKADELYSPEQIAEMGLILDSKLQPSRFRVYKLIKRGDLPAVNLGRGKKPKYYVRGTDLRLFVKKVLRIE